MTKNNLMVGRKAVVLTVAALALASVSRLALAQEVIDGGERTIPEGSTETRNFQVINGGTFNVHGDARNVNLNTQSALNVTGSVWDVFSSGQSVITIDGGSAQNITADGASIVNVTNGVTQGIRLTGSFLNASGLVASGQVKLENGSVANLSGVTINYDRQYALLLQDGAASTANVSGSSIAGGGTGILVARDGVLNLSGTRVTGQQIGDATTARGTGVMLLDGTVNVNGGSLIAGTRNGVLLLQGRSDVVETRSLTIGGSTVEGETGAAISVEGRDELPRNESDILIANGSKLVGGNGNLLEVDRNSSARFTVDNSALEGNVAVEAGGSADITIQNNGSIKGTFSGVDELKLNSGGAWKLIGDDSMGHIAMDGGAVEISDGSGDQYNTLTLGSLSGAGTFVMGTNLARPDGDRLVVTDVGGASGEHTLHVKNSGAEPTAEHEWMVVDTNGGDAQFDLKGGAADLGVFKYYLEQRGGDWFLVGSDETTPGTDTAVSLHGVAPTVFYGELATLRQRMGDVRLNGGKDGVWARTYGRGFSVKAGAGQAFDQSQWGATVGADREVSLGGINLLVGVLAGYSNSRIELDGGSQGDVDSYYGGLYATWQNNAGWYVDGVFKVNRFNDSAHIVMSDGAGAKGSYSATGVGAQIEVGRHIGLRNDWYVEPFVQLAGVRVGSAGYWLDNGMHVANGAMGSLVGRLGATVGFNHAMANGGTLQPYLRLAVAQEFAEGNTLQVNDTVFDNDLKGTRGEVGVGFAAQLSPNFQLHGDFDYANGDKIEQNWGLNLGAKYSF
ncbi:autotransporter outer membrane beta-barrel domain-containing protein [Mesorhizobium retamae]|uniref:Autotransporter outer membrane beta-barrel domain-containing protein n=1 Tax=Mesorhizobium retamae TaxID=2912854 RepID=A0ABS9QNH3_9HYPH|nr:autotransporter outer membrane beta-barrel domain-containing protein [Mesorhizobium sp. IRAMC:0171]MCG7508987.1 autotransporter outer membrane beta-barrel domain-containing protein [Mesorhizobium sp. IRAMC:0171]